VLPTFEIEPTEPQRGTVIWLHGLGASNHDFDPVIPELRTPYLRFVFPAAPVRPVTINGGMPMPAWYDILSFDNPPLREKESDVREAEQALLELIGRENERGVPAERVVLAGFSQGGAMALHVGLRAREPLAGVLVLSAYLLLPQHLDRERAPASTRSPILFAHGRFDPVVPFELGRRAYDRVTLAGHTARWEAFDMEHSLCIEEVEVIAAWLAERFAKPAPSPSASTLAR
jgi:phospholipase/carboxylesterase